MNKIIFSHPLISPIFIDDEYGCSRGCKGCVSTTIASIQIDKVRTVKFISFLKLYFLKNNIEVRNIMMLSFGDFFFDFNQCKVGKFILDKVDLSNNIYTFYADGKHLNLINNDIIKYLNTEKNINLIIGFDLSIFDFNIDLLKVLLSKIDLVNIKITIELNTTRLILDDSINNKIKLLISELKIFLNIVICYNNGYISNVDINNISLNQKYVDYCLIKNTISFDKERKEILFKTPDLRLDGIIPHGSYCKANKKALQVTNYKENNISLCDNIIKLRDNLIEMENNYNKHKDENISVCNFCLKENNTYFNNNL